MPGISLQTVAIVLQKRPPSDRFQTLRVFSAEQGLLTVLQRMTTRRSAGAGINHLLDLFDEAELELESRNQGQTWFVREARLRNRAGDLGRNYETLRQASDLAGLVTRHPGPAESHPLVAELLRAAFAAFRDTDRPDIVYFKSLFRFSRDEGYPVREDWLERLSAADRQLAEQLLHQPVAELTISAEEVARLRHRLEDYLRGHTEILPE